jgi:2-methylisocitrate lyase-like PEP mutase family enzyme
MHGPAPTASSSRRRRSIDELARVGTALAGVPLMANMLEGGRTPILRPVELEALGFRIVIYGISLLMRITRTMQACLEDLRSGELKLVGIGVGFEEYKSIVGFPQWAVLESRYTGMTAAQPAVADHAK